MPSTMECLGRAAGVVMPLAFLQRAAAKLATSPRYRHVHRHPFLLPIAVSHAAPPYPCGHYKQTLQDNVPLRARVMRPLSRPYWHARHTSHDQTGGGWTVPLRSVHAARRPGMPRGRRHSQVIYSHAGVSVHAAMCLALALGRRCGLAGACLCQNCVRFSPRPASSKLS